MRRDEQGSTLRMDRDDRCGTPPPKFAMKNVTATSAEQAETGDGRPTLTRSRGNAAPDCEAHHLCLSSLPIASG